MGISILSVLNVIQRRIIRIKCVFEEIKRSCLNISMIVNALIVVRMILESFNSIMYEVRNEEMLLK